MPDEPWVPDEPDAAWPPDAVPVVVNHWERSPGGARAHPLARRSYAVLEKRDHGPHRVRRFAEAWRSLRQASAARLRDPAYLEWLYGEGVIRPGGRPERHASRREATPAGAPPPRRRAGSG